MGLRVVYISIILFVSLSIAQAQNVSQDYQKKWNEYQRTLPGTFLHLFLNQEKYYPGDTIFFSAYFFFEDLSIVKGPQVIEVNLCDSNGKSMQRSVVMLKEGLGANQLVVPEDLPAGFYLITAHSNWMRNFNERNIFKKAITIVNENEVESESKCAVQATAEGGHLVHGIENQVIISSNQASAQVLIKDDKQQIIQQNQTDSHGLAAIRFTPQTGAHYTVQVREESCVAALPEVIPQGIVMELEHQPENVITLHLRKNAATDYEKETLILVVTTKARVQYLELLKFDGNETTIKLPAEKFPHGINHVEVTTAAGNTLAFRDFYNENRKTTAQVTITTDKPQYSTREKVSMEITVTDANGKPLEGEFALRVINGELFQHSQQSANHNHLDSAQSKKFDYDLVNHSEALPWKKILEGSKPTSLYPFRTVIERKGRVVYEGTDTPVPDFTQILFYLQRSKLFHQTFTENKGQVGLTLQGITGQDEFYYLAAHQGKYIPVDVQWEKDSINLPAAPTAISTRTPDRFAVFMERKRFIDQAFNAYQSTASPASVIESSTQHSDFEKEVAVADVNINVRDYVNFSSMHELIHEVVPSVYSRVSKKRAIVRVSLAAPLMAAEDPLYVIDGIATRNTAFFLALNPANLKEIKVINSANKLIPLGLLGKNGIVIVNTLKGNEREPLDSPDKLIEGVMLPVDFKAREVAPDIEPDKPDFRSTLYWNPLIKTDANGKAAVTFFCTDDPGKMIAEVEGRTMKLGLFGGSVSFQVLLKPADE